MLALIMAGGKGTRLDMGEKGLVRLQDIPLIEYVLDATEKADLEIIVVTTPHTPYTANYCRTRGIDLICTKGAGYIEDIIEVFSILDEQGPVLIICADLPGITAKHLNHIISAYHSEDRPACSAWIPAELLSRQGCNITFSRNINGICAVPIGVNILLGECINEEQDETCVLLTDPALAFNVNTRHELANAEEFFS